MRCCNTKHFLFLKAGRRRGSTGDAVVVVVVVWWCVRSFVGSVLLRWRGGENRIRGLA